MNKWISVDERLPDRELLEHMHHFPKEISLELIVHIVGAAIATVLNYDGEHFLDEHGNQYTIDYWTTLPELPDEIRERYE